MRHRAHLGRGLRFLMAAGREGKEQQDWKKRKEKTPAGIPKDAYSVCSMYSRLWLTRFRRPPHFGSRSLTAGDPPDHLHSKLGSFELLG
jgi:hypothetical protein